jgi:hypothetical protein
MKKNLIIITSHCDTKEKKEILLTLLQDLQNFKSKFDILLTSHVPIDHIFYPYIDYVFFDKNNTLLTDLDYRQNSWFQPFDNYVIWSSYTEKANTLAAIWDMIVPSISIAKTLGYEKIHCIEYDSRVFSDAELVDNDKLLDKYDYIVYGSEHTHKMIGSLLSFNTNSIIDEWKIPSNLIFEKLFSGVYPKTPENIVYNLISNTRNVLKKNNNILEKNGIKTALVRGNKFYWEVPFYDPKDFKLKFISYNINQENYDTKIIINNEIYFYLPPKNEFNWDIITLSDSIDTVQSLVVFRNNTNVLSLDFNQDNFKQKFIQYNSVLDNLSIQSNTII